MMKKTWSSDKRADEEIDALGLKENEMGVA